MSDALARNVVMGIMGMGLIHFKGKNVVSCHLVQCSLVPCVMDNLIDVFLCCSNVVVINNLRNVCDLHCNTIDAPKKLFLHVQSHCNGLLIKPNGWICPEKKTAFLAKSLELAAMANFPQDVKPKAESPSTTNPMNGGGNDNVKQDFKGHIVDRNAPKPGEPTNCERDSCTKH